MNSLARALRKNSTEAERCLWSRLRARRLHGVKFRRQQVLGPYVVDFLCLEPKVVIEVDGGQHAEQVSNDLQRTEYLKVLGYRVIRFWNHDVLGDPEAVLESIRAALVEIPSPPPYPGTVTPAKAGVQCDAEKPLWIPAFAGMT